MPPSKSISVPTTSKVRTLKSCRDMGRAPVMTAMPVAHEHRGRSLRVRTELGLRRGTGFRCRRRAGIFLRGNVSLNVPRAVEGADAGRAAFRRATRQSALGIARRSARDGESRTSQPPAPPARRILARHSAVHRALDRGARRAGTPSGSGPCDDETQAGAPGRSRPRAAQIGQGQGLFCAAAQELLRAAHRARQKCAPRPSRSAAEWLCGADINRLDIR